MNFIFGFLGFSIFLLGWAVGRSGRDSRPMLPEDMKLRCFAKLLGEPRETAGYIQTDESVWYQQGIYEGLIERVEKGESAYYCLTESGRMWVAYPAQTKSTNQ
jgi:hypothetical protein